MLPDAFLVAIFRSQPSVIHPALSVHLLSYEPWWHILTASLCKESSFLGALLFYISLRRADSNRRPGGYESPALKRPLSYDAISGGERRTRTDTPRLRWLLVVFKTTALPIRLSSPILTGNVLFCKKAHLYNFLLSDIT